MIGKYRIGKRDTRSPASPRRRRLRVETLENRLPFASDWQNPFNSLDVDDDGIVAPIDALVSVNSLLDQLTTGAADVLPDRLQNLNEPYFDTDGDGNHSPIDVLLIFNALNGDHDAPVISLKLDHDTAIFGGVNGDGITSDPAISGTLVDKTGVSTLVVSLDGTPISPESFDRRFNTFRVQPDSIVDGLTEGSHQLTVEAIDALGNRSTKSTLRFEYRSTAPAAPELSTTGIANQAINGVNRTVSVSGKTSPNARVRIGTSRQEVLANDSGEFRFDGVSLIAGDNQLAMIASDVAGNVANSLYSVSVASDGKLSSSKLAAPTPRYSSYLMPSNLGVPFPFLQSGSRQWNVMNQSLANDITVKLRLSQAKKVLAAGERISLDNFGIMVGRDGRLDVQSRLTEGPTNFDVAKPLSLVITLEKEGQLLESQELELRVAPPDHPITYYSDLADDLISVLMKSSTGEFQDPDQGKFDQYFRRLQAHGVNRLVVWQGPFPLLADPANYRAEDWSNYVGQATALLDSPELTQVLRAQKGFTSWQWLRELMKLRMDPGFGTMYTKSAEDHGIALSASFHPFDPTVSKYYSVPTFNASGRYLWSFLPLASPEVNFHPDEVGYAHYRKILSDGGQQDAAQVRTVVIRGAKNVSAFMERWNQRKDNLKVFAAPIAPMQDDSMVLQRAANGAYSVRLFRDIRASVESQFYDLQSVTIEQLGPDAVQIRNLSVPTGFPYLWISDPSGSLSSIELDANQPIEIYSTAGNRLGRESLWWVADGDTPRAQATRVSSINQEGEINSESDAVSNSISMFGTTSSVSLSDNMLVVNLGADWNADMLDFNQPAARQYSVKELKTILSNPAFDEIFVNTRSHADLPAYLGQGDAGIQPISWYRSHGLSYQPLGLDRAYAPRTAMYHFGLATIASNRSAIEKITTWQPAEWDGPCQASANQCGSNWRLVRNQESARGLRKLFEDIAAAFPSTHIRAVLPPSGDAIAQIEHALETMPRENSRTFGANYIQQVYDSLNYIPAIGEGLSMVDLAGLNIEPVMLGIRGLPEIPAIQTYVTTSLQDIQSRMGANASGPLAIMYDAQESFRSVDLTVATHKREQIMLSLLGRRSVVDNVILYGASSWLYRLPILDANAAGHRYLDVISARKL